MCCNLRKTERYKLCIHSCCCIQSKYHATFAAQKHIRWNTQKKKGAQQAKNLLALLCVSISPASTDHHVPICTSNLNS